MNDQEQSSDDEIKSLTSSQRLTRDIDRYSVKFAPEDSKEEMLRKLALGVNNATRISLETKLGVQHAISESKKAWDYAQQTRQIYEDSYLVVQKLEERNNQMDGYLEKISHFFSTVGKEILWWLRKFFQLAGIGLILLLLDYICRHWLHVPLPSPLGGG